MKNEVAGLCMFLTLLAISAVAEEGVVLLKNGSFENPMDVENWTCDQPAQWIRWGNWMNRETGWRPTKQGECLIGFHHFRLKGEDNAGFYQDVRDAQKNQPYTFSIWAWIDKDANAEDVRLEIHSYHGGSVITSKVFRLSRFDRDQWVQLSITGSSPDDGLRLMVIANPKKNAAFPKGAIKFDVASLEKTVDSAAALPKPNPVGMRSINRTK